MGSLALCFPIVAAAVTIDTTGEQSSFFGFGEQDPNSPFVYHETFGQTITVPESETVLDRFAFLLSGPGGGTFAAYVMKWTGTQATGPVRYESAPRPGPSAGYVPVAFETGGLSLKGGGNYVVFLSGSKFMDGNRRKYSTDFKWRSVQDLP